METLFEILGVGMKALGWLLGLFIGVVLLGAVAYIVIWGLIWRAAGW